MKRIFTALLVFVSLIVPTVLFAQTDASKVYSYDQIYTSISVQPDSTFTVEEWQKFNYQSGIFHQGLRSIPLGKVSRIDGVSVIDGADGQPLQYSSNRLDKASPTSWGKYTYYTSGGNLNIEWYYNLTNTKHVWDLHYTVHGGVEFYKENDRLYWNIFSGYDVPVSDALVRVAFPKGMDFSKLKIDAYRTGNQVIGNHIQSPEWVDFETFAVTPGEAFTIDIAFPKGTVKESAFWKEWIQSNFGYVGSALVILLSVLFLIIYRYYTERYKKGRGIIIAQYEPPQQLHPAMAEVVVKETITNKAWPATIVDLAVRGYVRVVEEDPGLGSVIAGIIVLGIVLIFSGIIGATFITVHVSFLKLVLFAFPVIIAIIIVFKSTKNIKQLLVPKSYRIEKIKEYAGDQNMEEYEKKFLGIIFSEGKDQFSLREMKQNQTAQRALVKSLNELKQDLYEETDKDTKAFANGMSKSKYFGYVLMGLILISYVVLRGHMINFSDQLLVFVATSVVAVICIISFILFEPRLSNEGYLLKEDWLGFKLYLETAEKYRMQNLTPDIFEKYLPYAMIFGIEKKWAKSFEAISMQPPVWYGATSAGVVAGTYGGASFSPVTFSSSFSSSFTSAFASSGGGGTGGGGGSAGGGGGGGGGGAS